MNTELLKTFLAICDSMNFTSAAERVGRSQSAVSLQIQRLELSLGRPLFTRGQSRLALTEHGVLLREHARRILDTVREAEAAFHLGAVEGVVVLGMPDDYAPRFLSPVLQSFVALYPDATIKLVIDESRQLVKQLAEGSVDLALITQGEGPTGGGPVAFHDSIVWVGSDTHELHRRDPLPIAIWDQGDGYASRMFDALAKMGRRHKIVLTCRSMTGLRGAAQAGIAITAMMRSGLTPGLRVLDQASGFAPLAQLSVRLERAHQKKSPLIDRLEAHLLLQFSDTDSSAVTPAPPA